MNYKSLFFLSLFLGLFFSGQSNANIALSTTPYKASLIPAPPALTAKSYILMDYLSDSIMVEQDVDQRVSPASLTKMMTIYVIDQALKEGKIKPTDLVTISEHAWRATGSRMFAALNSKISVEELLKGVIIQSGNDASIALAEHLGGSESAFAEMMNFYAQTLGMYNTHFVNSTGLSDPNHYTTARDLAILAKALIADFPQSYSLYSKKEFVYNNIKQPNRNRLLWRYDWVDGIKTGYTEEAGYCLVASGKREDMRLIAIVMGTENDAARTDEAAQLLNYGFRFFETRKLYPKEIPLKQSRVWMGRDKETNLGLAKDLYVTIGRGQYDLLKSQINTEPVIKAPLEVGTVLGTITIQLEDKVIAERPIISLNAVKGSNFIGRTYDSVNLTVQNLISKLPF